MGLQSEWIRYGDSGEYLAYSARLEGLRNKAPAVIVLQEIWGVDDHIRDVANRFAQAGYVAVAPDLFAVDGIRPHELEAERVNAAKAFLNSIPQASWRNPEERKSALAKLPDEQAVQLEETLSRIFNLGDVLDRFRAQTLKTAQYLRTTYSATAGEGVASVGFCLGGALSAVLAAQDPELSGAVIFYGSPPSDDLIASIQTPIIGFYGELDARITDAVPPFAEKLKEAGKSFHYEVYPDAPHAFFNDTRPSYREKAARDAFAGTLVFLNQVLNR